MLGASSAITMYSPVSVCMFVHLRWWGQPCHNMPQRCEWIRRQPMDVDGGWLSQSKARGACRYVRLYSSSPYYRTPHRPVNPMRDPSYYTLTGFFILPYCWPIAWPYTWARSGCTGSACACLELLSDKIWNMAAHLTLPPYMPSGLGIRRCGPESRKHKLPSAFNSKGRQYL